jgi:Concanavalin A-like lectin/glucanases superfamily
MRRVSLVAALAAVLALVAVPAASAAPHQQSGLVLFNTLGSRYQVLHSKVGPDLQFCSGGCAVPAWVQGHTPTDHAITIGPGTYYSEEAEQNVLLTDPAAVLDSDQGTLSVWFKENAAPVAYSYGVYRIFGGAFGPGGEAMQLYMDASTRLYFNIGTTDSSTQVGVNGLKDGQPGIAMDYYIGKWIHIRAVWNRNGIGTSGQTLQLWINGSEKGAATASGWTTDMGTVIDIAGGQDNDIAGKFDEGQLRIYNTNP